MSKTSRNRYLLLFVILLAVLIYLFVPSVNESINEIVKRLSSGDFDDVRLFIQSYGTYAAAFSFFLMVLTSVIAPLPAFVITVANANLFGWWQGALLSWSSAMVGAALCFYISRILGRDVAERFATRAGLEKVDRFFEKYGKTSILIARLLPFMSFDLVSYAAGLTSMGFWGFFVATGLGQTPATIIYSYVGGMLSGGAQKLVTGLLILFALSALVALMASVWKSRNKEIEVDESTPSINQ